jgi:predicted dehydrogenase
MITFLIAGFGSIGRRHLRNLQALGQSDVILYRTGKSTLATDEEVADLPVFYDLDDALAQRPTAVIVANPTALHMDVALRAARAGCHLLLEKPIAHNLEGVPELARLAAESGLHVLVGFQFRYHPGLRRLKQWLDEDAIGAVSSVQAHWGEYLPAWHPWEDYRHSYSVRPDLGGGVALTLCHPFDYLRWLIGEVETVAAFGGNQGGLDILVPDTISALLRFANGVTGQVHLDYVQRPTEHRLQITGQGGTIRWDNADGAAHCYRASTGEWETFSPAPTFERNDLFLAETQNFLDCLTGSATPQCTAHDGIRALQIALCVEQSIQERRLVALPEDSTDGTTGRSA